MFGVMADMVVYWNFIEITYFNKIINFLFN